MGLFTKKFTEDDGVTTAAKWRKAGVIEENLRDLANRIRAGESKGYVSDLYRYKGGVYVPLKFEEVNLQDIYDKVKDGWESLERSIALEKDLHRRTTEILDSVFNDGLNLDLDDDDDDDDDDGNASKFDLDDEVAKLEAELEEALKEDEANLIATYMGSVSFKTLDKRKVPLRGFLLNAQKEAMLAEYNDAITEFLDNVEEGEAFAAKQIELLGKS